MSTRTNIWCSLIRTEQNKTIQDVCKVHSHLRETELTIHIRAIKNIDTCIRLVDVKWVASWNKVLIIIIVINITCIFIFIFIIIKVHVTATYRVHRVLLYHHPGCHHSLYKAPCVYCNLWRTVGSSSLVSVQLWNNN